MKKDLIISIFGSTGDLTARKLLPALTKLYKNKSISNNILVLALGRRPYDTDGYLEAMQNLIEEKLDIKALKQFVVYYQMQITESYDYENLKKYVEDFSSPNTKHIYYLAIGPEILPTVAKN